MHACSVCDRTFDSRQKLGGHIGSHNRGSEYLAKRKGKRNSCLTCDKPTKNPKFCSHACKSKYTASKLVISKDGTTLDITREELTQYRMVQLTCEICGREETTTNPLLDKPNRLCADHDHNSSKFRGLLCCVCNRQLGWYENNKDKIEKYLNKV